ncbi:MAG TPA: NAD(P)H-dependent oxidoreductase subunit E [Bacillota bacterium]|nr:NAD(P)H-dependent oxidoreductase subunit E [Bacillota bacterium]
MGTNVDITQEKIDQLLAEMAEHKKKQGPLMPTLHSAQRIFGCIPIQVQKIISKELDISVARINGVVTFYGHFSVVPKGKNVISVCLGTACYVKGSEGILDTIAHELKISVGETTDDGMFTLKETRCIGACGLAPVFMVNGEVYGNASVQMVKDIITKLKN